LFDF
jgi:hypothetical protein